MQTELDREKIRQDISLRYTRIFLIFFNPVILTCFSVDNYKVTVYTGIKYLAGTDARVFVELFGQNNGQSQNSGEVELAGKKDAFEMGR